MDSFGLQKPDQDTLIEKSLTIIEQSVMWQNTVIQQHLTKHDHKFERT